MNKRTHRMWTVVCTAILTTSLLAGAFGAVLAFPGGPPTNVPTIFELDASRDLSGGAAPKAAVTDNTGAGLPDDWDRVCHTGTAGTATPQCTGAANDHATARSFDSETTATGTANNATIFTGGGSKDQQPISAWGWKDASGGLPDKDNLLHAMTARYEKTNSYIFFAADRFDNSGDSQIGFWLFNNAVGTAANGTFSGSHKAGVVPHSATNSGDILILSDFTNGGTQPTIRIFEYVGSGGSDGSLNLLGGNATDIRDCAVVPTDDFCASVNNVDGAVAPWLFKNKSGQTSFGHGEFYEGGLNLNSFGLQNECFSSFLAETRSAQSVTATLKDFVGGTFQQCNASAVTTPSSTSVSPGTSVTDTIRITGTGPAVPPFPSSPPNVVFSSCGPIATGICDGSDTAHTAAAFGATKALSNTATQGVSTATSDAINTTGSPLSTGRYCFKGSWAGDTNYPLGASDNSATECFVVIQIPTTTVTTPSDSSGTALSGTQSLGTLLYDKAVVTANTTGGGNVTGTVDFFLCNPSQTTGVAGSEVCAAGGTNLSGNPRTLVPIAAASPPASSVLSSPGVAANVAGVWCFRAVYTPTGTNYTGSSDASHGECVTIGPENTTTVTTPSVGAGPVAVGTSVTDHAVVTAADAFDGTPTGTINFFICNPTEVTTNGGTCSTGGTAAGSKTASAVALSSPPASEATSDSITADVVGTWCFRAVYVPGGANGANYNGSSDSSSGECFVVNDSTSATSAQNWLPNDSATITSTGGTALTGTLSLQLYTDGTCGVASGSAVTGQLYSFTLTGAASPATRVTTNSTYKVSATGTVSWLVTFTSTDPNVGSSTHCESTSLTITN